VLVSWPNVAEVGAVTMPFVPFGFANQTRLNALMDSALNWIFVFSVIAVFLTNERSQ
jgi:hypothetical protein